MSATENANGWRRLSRCVAAALVLMACSSDRPLHAANGSHQPTTGPHQLQPRLELGASTGSWVIEQRDEQSFGTVSRSVVAASHGEVLCEGAPSTCELGTTARREVVTRLGAALEGQSSQLVWNDSRLSIRSDCPKTTLTIYKRDGNLQQVVSTYAWAHRSADQLPNVIRQLYRTVGGEIGGWFEPRRR